ncbi:DUF6502 family protein [Pseudohongiella sp.]|uniref:Uncharacterized protein n=1 Tax=marine sediment metagenome TaxID=412755 RepID=A0A0F9Z447_9ZZZZ|nr:DUF6502 family protein [Pseudohongiella sp.]HDZ08546.1 hypothetical protein [Pseudohongiella sp.]HEA61716.1 hypothetical protein [Pseudohongiella sp.]
MSDNNVSQSPGQPPAALVTALRKLLRPLVRLLLSFQVSYPYLTTLLKSIYVDVADSEFSVDGKRQSDSRITLLTGVHRKDVKRLRSEQADAAVLPANISVGAQLIANWLGSACFRDASGKPLPLPLRSAQAGEEACFDDLVEMVCRQDIRPRVILDEWIHLGVAHQDEQGRVVLNTGAFTPDKGFDEKVFFFGKNLHDHISAGTHNLLGNKPAFFDRSVYYDRLSENSIQALNELAEELGMNALRALNNEALALQRADAESSAAAVTKSAKTSKNPNRFRMNFGIFHYNSRYENHTDKQANTQDGTQSQQDQDNA